MASQVRDLRGASPPAVDEAREQLRDAFEADSAAPDRLRDDRARSARFVAHLRARAPAHRRWWFRDEAAEAVVRARWLAVADAAEREARPAFELLERHLAARPGLVVCVVADLEAGQLRRAEVVAPA
jgi:hypothetical protein